jgi:hypothetical protein
LGDDHADALVAGTPDHAIAGDQRRQVGAQVAAEYLAGSSPSWASTSTCTPKCAITRPSCSGPRSPPSSSCSAAARVWRRGGAFALDLFDAPVLATIELAFGHEVFRIGGAVRKRRRV